MTLYSNFFFFLSLMALVQGHMELSWPPAFRSKFNPHAVSGTVDYSMTSPLKTDGSEFPCKGYHKDMQDTTGAGTPGATWNAGSTYNYSVVGGASHNGGSCQASLSYDNGATFKVIHSYIGDCPTANGGVFNFVVPSDASSGNAIFAWSWLNQVGNREYYMNCASVKIVSGSSGTGSDSPKVSFSSRPNIFVANLGNGCTTIEGKDTVYPNPGPDVTSKSSGGSDASSTLTGQCGTAAVKVVQKLLLPSIPGLGNSSDPTDSINIIPVNNSNTSPYATAPYATTASMPTNSAYPTPSGSPYGDTKVSSNGECGGIQTCSGSSFGQCCSRYGFCGETNSHCGDGCMENFGECGINATSSKLRIRGSYNRLFL